MLLNTKCIKLFRIEVADVSEQGMSNVAWKAETKHILQNSELFQPTFLQKILKTIVLQIT
jgi:hypothetical protein